MRSLAVVLVVLTGVLLTGCAQLPVRLPGSPPDRVNTSASGSGSPEGGVDAGRSEGGSPGSAEAHPLVPPAIVVGGAGTKSDLLAADVVTGVEQYWRERFPTLFGRRWINLTAYHAVDPANPGLPVPCRPRPGELADQAVYCASANLVAWDRVGLIPRLRSTYGTGAVLVALAHEIGHAVQDRLGIDPALRVREPNRFPTILLEGMADCFAGVVLHAAVDGQIRKVMLSRPDLDRALRALLSFRDPVGLTVSATAHGDAFDRASAFLDGYQNGPVSCATMTAENRLFTQRAYTSVAEAIQGGDLPLSGLLRGLGPDANSWFGALVTSRGRPWRPSPAPTLTSGVVPARCAGGHSVQGPAGYCAATGSVTVSTSELERVHQLGDYAAGEVVASRYALAALDALGQPVRGAQTGRSAVCLTGAYTRALLDRPRGGGFGLSPGDIDEAVEELLDHDFAARDADGRAPGGDLGLERVRQFRTGMLNGPTGCGI